MVENGDLECQAIQPSQDFGTDSFVGMMELAEEAFSHWCESLTMHK